MDNKDTNPTNNNEEIKLSDEQVETRYTIYSRGEPLATSSSKEEMEGAISNMDQHANLIRETITTTHSNITPAKVTKNKYGDY